LQRYDHHLAKIDITW